MTGLLVDHSRERLCSAVLSLAVLGSAIAGCDLSKSRLLSLHMEDDQRAGAQKRWNDVRGRVKLQLAQDHYAAGRTAECETVLREARALAPDDPEVFVLAARLRLDQGRLAEAREAIAVAAALNQSDAEIPYLAGLVAQRYGELESAYDYFTQAAQLGPNTPAYLLARADVLLALNRPADALDLIRSRLMDFDDNVSLRMLAARACRILGLRRPAIAFCRDAIRIAGDDPALVAELGRLLIWSGSHREAIAVLAPLVDDPRRVEITNRPIHRRTAAPSDQNAHLTGQASRSGVEPAVVPSSVIHDLARAYLAVGQADRVRQLVKPLMRADESDSLAWMLFARASLMKDDFAAARSAVDKLETLGDVSAESYLLSAYAALRSGDTRSTCVDAMKALDFDAESAMAHCLLGQAAEAEGREAAALDAYARALELEPYLEVARVRFDALSRGRRAARGDGQLRKSALSALPEVSVQSEAASAAWISGASQP